MKKLTIIFFVLATLLLACTQTPDTNPPATNPPATPDPLAEDGNAKDAKDQANEAPQDQAKSEKDAKDPADEAPQVQAEEEKTAKEKEALEKEKEALEKEKEAKEKEKEAKAPAGEAPQVQAGKVAKDPAGEAPKVQTEEEKSIADLKDKVKKYNEKIASAKSASASDLKSVDIISDTKFTGSQEDKKDRLYEALGYNKEVIEALGEVFKELKLSSKPTNKKTAEDVLDLLEKFTDTTHKVLKSHLTDQNIDTIAKKPNAKTIIDDLTSKVTGTGFMPLRDGLIDDLHKHIKEAKANKGTESKMLDALKKIVDEKQQLFMKKYKTLESQETEIKTLVS
ncbi:hypothetical protein [Candidatus Borreliella tachyglossi]|uniref:hypothetical protein n=1 Tax=Candidatus Borreliella tachyglossi TaxID=1964448 RepID=UPI00404194EB